ncbi:hypothetical protein HPB47_027510 [Ixodes persulcatus]|uniref:Uncharacterized protein n=1 Tax=Ixodes persulcatus TaxID=34615 RepID=A0AC60PVR9_IXOPE|nr:hypothetical protein HPB47_027510 [Ixodes persulcatus]
MASHKPECYAVACCDPGGWSWKCWRKARANTSTGKVPPSWRHAIVCFVPKPGKQLALTNLRPISLTSCVGKLMERVIQRRLQEHMEPQGLFPHHMYGFRNHLSTQDIFLQIHKDYYSRDARWQAVAALDLRKAFQRIAHSAILEQMSRLNLGDKAYNYVKSFLTDITAQIKLGNHVSDLFAIGPLPLLFKLAMIPISQRLEQVPYLKHAMYADDITLWTNAPPPWMEKALQQGTDIVAEEAARMELECASEKPVLLARSPLKKGKALLNFQVQIQGQPIPRVEPTKILGMTLHANAGNMETLRILRKQADNVARLIRRISHRHYGLGEKDTCRLIQAFVLSRITYAAPYMALSQTAIRGIDAIIRKAYMTVLGLPQNTSKDRLEPMGLHNSFQDLCEAQRKAQHHRLVELQYGQVLPPKWDISKEWRKRIVIKPLPRNMDPRHNNGRREARAQALNKIHNGDPTVYHAYASPYPGQPKKYVITAFNLEHSHFASVAADNIDEAEEAAVALSVVAAAKTANDSTITTDSRTAIVNYLRGRIGTPARKLLCSFRSPTGDSKFKVIWVPAHSNHSGSEAAHSMASRALSNRDDVAIGWTVSGEHNYAAPPSEDFKISFNEATRAYRDQRGTLPPPHKELNHQQARTWRRLQAFAILTPRSYHKIYPHLFDGTHRDTVSANTTSAHFRIFLLNSISQHEILSLTL